MVKPHGMGTTFNAKLKAESYLEKGKDSAQVSRLIFPIPALKGLAYRKEPRITLTQIQIQLQLRHRQSGMAALAAVHPSAERTWPPPANGEQESHLCAPCLFSPHEHFCGCLTRCPMLSSPQATPGCERLSGTRSL